MNSSSCRISTHRPLPYCATASSRLQCGIRNRAEHESEHSVVQVGRGQSQSSLVLYNGEQTLCKGRHRTVEDRIRQMSGTVLGTYARTSSWVHFRLGFASLEKRLRLCTTCSLSLSSRSGCSPLSVFRLNSYYHNANVQGDKELVTLLMNLIMVG